MTRIIFSVTLLALTLTACAEDPDGAIDAPGAAVAVPEETRLSALTADQRVALCRSAKASAATLSDPTFLCEVRASVEADSPAACEAATRTCVAEKEAAASDADPCATAADTPIDCAAEVRLYQACLDEQIAGFLDAFGALRCPDAADLGPAAMIEAAVMVSLLTPSCRALETVCPDAFLDATDPPGGE